MKKSAFILMLVALFSKILGFGRDLTLSYFYGVSNITDAYLVATTIPLVIFSFIGTGISTSYIPMYNKIKTQISEREAKHFTSNLINVVLIMCVFILLLSILFSKKLVYIFASGFDYETHQLTVEFMKIAIFSIFFSAIVFILSGYLQVKENYMIPSLVGIPLNLVTILFIILSSNNSTKLLVVGSVVAVFSQVVFMYYWIKRAGYNHKFVFSIRNNHIYEIIRISIPAIIGISINQINVLVDRTIASNIVTGGIAALNYSNRLILFVQGIFVTSIITVFFPRISKLVALKNIDEMKKNIEEVSLIILFFVIPSIVMFVVFSEQIIKMLFGRGAFDGNGISITSEALAFYSIGLLGYAFREIFSRVFYSFQDTKTPAVNAAIAVVINIILNIVLSKIMGLNGLALATSISALICTFLLYISMTKKIGKLPLKRLIISTLKLTICSLLMGNLGVNVFEKLSVQLSESVSVLTAIFLGGISYILMASIMHFGDVKKMVRTYVFKVK